MRFIRLGAAAFLALAFGFVSYLALVVEPAAGLATFADFFDPVRFTAMSRSSTANAQNVIYLLIPVAIVALTRSTDDRDVMRSGTLAALFFLFLGSMGEVARQLPSLVSNEEVFVSAVAAWLLIRFAILKTTVVVFGVFAWTTTRMSSGTNMISRAWRALGWLVLGCCVLFIFVLVPVPLIFFVWAVALTIQSFRSAPVRGQLSGSAPS